MINTKSRKKIGLALGSGGARGFAHIGVIKVLKENNIPIDYIAGSSMGAVIGGSYASHLDIVRIEKAFLKMDLKKVLKMSNDFNFFSDGLLTGNKLKEFIKADLKSAHKFLDLKIPFMAVATDARLGNQVPISSGNLIEAIRASVSIPGILKPVKIGKQELIDGGLANPVPVNIVRSMGADVVIAVNLEGPNKEKLKQNFFSKKIYNNLVRPLKIMKKNLTDLCSLDADVVIYPAVSNIYWNEFRNAKHLIKMGEIATKKLLPAIKKATKN